MALHFFTIIGMLLCCYLNTRGCLSLPSTRYANHTANNTLNASCDRVNSFFQTMNVSVQPAATHQHTTCGGWCCSDQTEEKLRQRAREDFENLIHHHSQSLQGLLATTADALRDTVIALVRQSENKTLTLFEQVYRSMAMLTRTSAVDLYQTMADYLSQKSAPQPEQVLRARLDQFFWQLFLVAYHNVIDSSSSNGLFTDKFQSCLKVKMMDAEAFGDIPNQIAGSLIKSLEASRVLYQALTLGNAVLQRADSVLVSANSLQQQACYKALLRMTYCPKCKNIASSVMPCSGFCTNVIRGCLTEPASELDLAWSGYVETVERLVVAVDGNNDPLGLNPEKAIRQLDKRISEAVMLVIKNNSSLEEKVRAGCGRAQFRKLDPEEEESKRQYATHRTVAMTSAKIPNQLYVQFGNFLASIVRSRTFYGTLADSICEDYPDKRCWNGERVGEYTHTVVDSSLTAQRYNPEFVLSTSGSASVSYANLNTSVLIDQLRHINQMVQTQLASAPDTSALLSDEAFEGSGSGDRPVWGKDRIDNTDTDDEDRTCVDCDDDDDGASGSGMGPVPKITQTEIEQDPTLVINRDGNSDSGSSASTTVLSASLTLILVSVSLFAT